MNQTFFSKQEINRVTGRAAEEGTKFAFKWIGVAIKAFVDFVKTMVSQALGK